jgi:hypothetical protein
MGLRGCVEAIKAPTRGKTRKRTPPNMPPTVRSAPQLLGTSADRASTNSGTLAANTARERPASDQASQGAARVRLCLLALSATIPVYGTIGPQTLRGRKVWSSSAGDSWLLAESAGKKSCALQSFAFAVASAVATTFPKGGRVLAERRADVPLHSTKSEGECCKDWTTLSPMRPEVTSVRHKTLKLCSLSLRNLLPRRWREGHVGTAQPIEDRRKVAPSRGLGTLHPRRPQCVDLAGFALSEGTC